MATPTAAPAPRTPLRIPTASGSVSGSFELPSALASSRASPSLHTKPSIKSSPRFNDSPGLPSESVSVREGTLPLLSRTVPATPLPPPLAVFPEPKPVPVPIKVTTDALGRELRTYEYPSTVTTNKYGTVEERKYVTVRTGTIVDPPSTQFVISSMNLEGKMVPGSTDEIYDPEAIARMPTVSVSNLDFSDPKEIGDLRRSRVDKLRQVFHCYDANGDGFLDYKDMRVFGWALSGQQRVPTIEEAVTQLRRADADKDDLLSVDEFLQYSMRLAIMPRDVFDDLVLVLLSGFRSAYASGLSATIHEEA